MKIAVVAVVAGFIIWMTSMAIQKNNAVPANIGINNGLLAPLPGSPNAVSSQTGNIGQFVDPWPFYGNIEQTKIRIKKAVNDFGGAQILIDQRDYLHAVFTTPVIPFKDDVEFLLDEKTGKVHYRSSSRLGYSDFGVNKNRYIRLSALYDKASN